MTNQISGKPVAVVTDVPAVRHSPKLFAFIGLLFLALTLGALPIQAEEGAASADTALTVNINRDDAATLAAGLNGVGQSRAEDIIRYREEFGPFTTVEQLSEVKGIGKATLDNNRARITLE